MTRSIYCCECKADVEARLTDGSEIYPHRQDLHSIPFWKCDKCSNFVGCHHKTKDRTKPLGCIPNQQIKNSRKHIHSILDPIWMNAKKRRQKRKEVYIKIGKHLGYEYHTAEIKDIEEARKIYRFIKKEYYFN